MEASTIQVPGANGAHPYRREAGLGSPSTKSPGGQNFGVPPSKFSLVRSAHWREQSGVALALKSGSLGARRILLSALPHPSSPLLFSFLSVALLSYPVLLGRKKASHKLISTPLTYPRASLASA